MSTGIERRRHSRVPLSLPVVLMTPQGAIKGKTANISVGGLALILFLEKPEIGDEFEITLKSSEDHEILVTCEKAWSRGFLADAFFNISIGVHFTEISFDDQEIIDSLIEKYYQATISKTKSRCKVTHSPFIN